MKRFFLGAVIAIGCGAPVFAGQIQVGQYAGNVSTGLNSGLTTAYVNQAANNTGTGTCVGAVYFGNNCAAGSVGGYIERGYDTTLFQGAALAGVQPGTAPVPGPYAGYTKAGAGTPGSTMTDGSAVTFAMLADGTNNVNGRNFWTATTVSSITIPVGVFGVSNVWTMLNNQFGLAGQNATSLTFTFGGTSDATSNLTQVVVDLINSSTTGGPGSGGQSASTGTGQIRSAVDCTTVGTSSCGSYSAGPLKDSSTLNTSVTVNNVAQAAGTVVVKTKQIYTTGYDSVAGTGYAGSTAGNITLDEQGFNFGGVYNGLYLVSVSVAEKFAVTGQSFTGLSAISIDTVPEPSTWLMFASAVGAMGFLRRRKNL